MRAELLQRLADDAALRRTAELYAQGADRRDKSAWRQVLAEDCVIEGPGFNLEGREAALGAIDQLPVMFKATVHRIHNQTVVVTGDTASGETYCTADHLLPNGEAILCWSVRYQDQWRRENGQWRFARRKLVVDWEEVRAVTAKAALT
jgi:hypothetical protein